MEKALLLINYPELISLNKEATKYDGYISINSNSFRIKLRIPNFPSIENLKCTIPSLSGTNYEKRIHDEQNNKNLNILQFLNNITTILNEYTNDIKKHNSIEFDILQQIQQLQKHKSVEKIRVDKRTFSKIKIKIHDAAERYHYVQINIENNQFFIHQHYLPEIPEKHDLLKKHKNLLELFELYLTCVDNLQPFLDAMDSIDAVCWVIEPQRPTSSDYKRRIVIGHNTSIQITFNPWNIYTRPKIQFLGSETVIEPFRKSFIDNMENWDPQYDIIQNILRLLDLPFFPMAPTDEENTKASNDLDFESNECCICFCVRLNDKLPEQICENRLCEQHFHTDCLYQWLISVASMHQNFNLIQGECPNCKSSITCPIPDS